MAYIRTNIFLSEKQKLELAELAIKKDIKAAELIRMALNEFIEKEKLKNINES